ncbi:MAG: hypothetical protein M1827_000577 [Pycnora praestabilis]|nr:MAG: hypothetical protein M1827_000577 [Pycnora praestabilis]
MTKSKKAIRDRHMAKELTKAISKEQQGEEDGATIGGQEVQDSEEGGVTLGTADETSHATRAAQWSDKISQDPQRPGPSRNGVIPLGQDRGEESRKTAYRNTINQQQAARPPSNTSRSWHPEPQAPPYRPSFTNPTDTGSFDMSQLANVKPLVPHQPIRYSHTSATNTTDPVPRGRWTGSPPKIQKGALNSKTTNNFTLPVRGPLSDISKTSFTPSGRRTLPLDQGLQGPPITTTPPSIPLKSKLDRRSSPSRWPSPTFVAKPLPTPAPTPAYLSQASHSPLKLPSPQPLLLILDLNGTLIHRPSRHTPSKFVSRPSVPSFLQYILTTHTVMIWSSARPHNVKALCSQLFTATQRQKLVAEWARDRLDLTQSQYDAKTQVHKRLEKVWADPSISKTHPTYSPTNDGGGGGGGGGGGRWSQANTILLDDSALKAVGQPYNLVQIPEFTGSEEGSPEKEMDVLGQVVAYLEEVKRWGDVSAFVRQGEFRVDGRWKWRWDGDGEGGGGGGGGGGWVK